MTTTHATCIVLGSTGVLIRGVSGAGKSELALALVADAAVAGTYAALVGDDRVEVRAAHGRLVARVPVTIAGLVEQRGRGIREEPHLPAAVVRLVVDLVPAAELDRMPDPDALTEIIAGIPVPRQPVPRGDVARAVPLVRAALAARDSGDPDSAARLARG